MYRVLTPLLSAAVLVAVPPGLRAADDDPKSVLAKAVKAHGGEETLIKHQAAQIRSKGKITLPGLGEVDYTQEVSYMMPDKFKDDLELNVAGQKIRVLTLANGDKITIEANGTPVDATDQVKTALKEARHMVKVGRLAPLVRDKGYELSSIGEIKIGDKPAVGIRVSAKGEKDINLYFDKETGLLAKLEHRTTDPTTGNEITEERIVTAYQKGKDGLPAPKKVVVKHDGKTFLDGEVLELTYFEKLDEGEFKK